MSIINNICEHGQLQRKCEVCELKDEVQQLREAVKVLAGDVVSTAMDKAVGDWTEELEADVMANPIAAAAIMNAAKERKR